MCYNKRYIKESFLLLLANIHIRENNDFPKQINIHCGFSQDLEAKMKIKISEILYQGSHRNSKTQFHDFSMIFHDQQCNFHDYLMHGLQPQQFKQHLHFFTTLSINAECSNSDVFK